MVHRAHKAARSALLLLASAALALLEAVIAELMRIAVAGTVPVAAAIGLAARLVSRILRRALTVALAELLLPPLGTVAGAILLLLSRACLRALLPGCLRLRGVTTLGAG
jgi:hypothetical protein